MTYQEIYDFYSYLQENNIMLSSVLKKDIIKSPLPKKAYFIVKYFDETIVKEYLNFVDSQQVLLFLEEHIEEKISSDEIIEAIKSIGALKEDLQVFMRKALSDSAIRNQPDVLNLICKQDNKFKMNEVRKAASDKKINQNIEWLILIASRKDELEMFVLRFYLRFDFIRENDYFVNLITSQNGAQKMSEMAKSLMEERIRKNSPIIELISHQNTAEDMREIRLAYLNDFITRKMSLFRLIVEQESAEEKRIIRIAIMDNKISNYEEGKCYIQEYKKVKEQDQILEEMILDEEQYRKMFALFADNIKEREYLSENLSR